MLEVRGPGTAFQTLELGSGMLPNSLIGPAPSMALTNIADFSLNIWSGYQPAFSTALGAMHAGVTHPVAKQAAITLVGADAPPRPCRPPDTRRLRA